MILNCSQLNHFPKKVTLEKYKILHTEVSDKMANIQWGTANEYHNVCFCGAIKTYLCIQEIQIFKNLHKITKNFKYVKV